MTKARVGLEGVGWDAYEEVFWDHSILRFEYAYVGLPALDAEQYVNGEHLLGEYRVALGLSPVGQKERERDFRTPEGHYFLARRNTRSDYFLAIQVTYPNKQDEVRARKNGWSPGGSIMIHGFPNSPHHPSAYYESNDWTDGCIALSNSDMVEVWMRTQDNIPIDIYP